MAPATVLCRVCHQTITRSNFWFQRIYISQHHPRPWQGLTQYSTDIKDKQVKREEEEEEPEKPFSYSKSKAADWTVDKSFGEQYSRPLWKVAPLSLALCAFVAWIFLREETELDRQLEVTLSERIPGLFKNPEADATETEEDEHGEEEKR